jgi:hypothetical protein
MDEPADLSPFFCQDVAGRSKSKGDILEETGAKGHSRLARSPGARLMESLGRKSQGIEAAGLDAGLHRVGAKILGGAYKGGSAQSGLAFEDSAGALRFLTNLPCDGSAAAVALQIRRTGNLDVPNE